MRKWSLAVALFVIVISVNVAFADSPKTIISQAIDVLNEIVDKNDVSTIGDLIDKGHGVAIVPRLQKAGFIIGGQHGYGVILAKKGKQWYGPSFFEMTGGSIGFQIGVETVSLLFCINNQAGMKAFTDNKSKLGANVGITAGPIGREAGAATDGSFQASIYSYSMSKGIYAGVNLDGSAIGASKKMNEEYWGKKFTIEEALAKKATKAEIKGLISALQKIEKRR